MTQININNSTNPSENLAQNADINWTDTTKHIICAQEPYGPKGPILNTPKNYKTLHTNKHKFPRAIIMISKPYNNESMFHENLSDRDNCTISIKDPKHKDKRLYITSCYLPGNEDIKSSLITEIIKEAKNKNWGLLICSDTNAHSTMWGNNQNNDRGDDLEDIIGKFNLSIANTEFSPTYYKGNKSSTIDLTITNDQAPKILNWCQLKGHSFSDHELIQFELIPDSDEGKENPVYKLSRKCDTKLYKSLLKEKLQSTNLQKIDLSPLNP